MFIEHSSFVRPCSQHNTFIISSESLQQPYVVDIMMMMGFLRCRSWGMESQLGSGRGRFWTLSLHSVLHYTWPIEWKKCIQGRAQGWHWVSWFRNHFHDGLTVVGNTEDKRVGGRERVWAGTIYFGDRKASLGSAREGSISLWLMVLEVRREIWA